MKNIEQTTRIVATLTFADFDRKGPRQINLVFTSLEKMLERWSIERRRRQRSERVTTGTYRLELTDHGRKVCANDPERAAAHAKMVGREMAI